MTWFTVLTRTLWKTGTQKGRSADWMPDEEWFRVRNRQTDVSLIRISGPPNGTVYLLGSSTKFFVWHQFTPSYYHYRFGYSTFDFYFYWNNVKTRQDTIWVWDVILPLNNVDFRLPTTNLKSSLSVFLSSSKYFTWVTEDQNDYEVYLIKST